MKLEFGNITKKVKETFTGEKEPLQMTQNEEKRRAAEIREASEKLKNKLRTVRFVDATGKIEKEKLEEYQAIIQVLAIKLDNAPASLMDTRKLDREMMIMVDELGFAIKEGHGDTVKFIVRALLFGIGKGHMALLLAEEEKAEQVMAGREDVMNRFKTIVGFSKGIDERVHQMAIQEEKHKTLVEELKEQREILLKEMHDKPELCDEIDRVGGDVKQLSPEAVRLVNKEKEFNNQYDAARTYQQTIALNEGEIVALRQQIKAEEVGLDSIFKEISKELLEDFQKHQEEFQKKLAEQKANIMKWSEISAAFNDALDYVFSSQEIKEYVVSTSMKFDEIIREMEQKEEGRKRALERQREQEAENTLTQDRILNN